MLETWSVRKYTRICSFRKYTYFQGPLNFADVSNFLQKSSIFCQNGTFIQSISVRITNSNRITNPPPKLGLIHFSAMFHFYTPWTLKSGQTKFKKSSSMSCKIFKVCSNILKCHALKDWMINFVAVGQHYNWENTYENMLVLQSQEN